MVRYAWCVPLRYLHHIFRKTTEDSAQQHGRLPRGREAGPSSLLTRDAWRRPGRRQFFYPLSPAAAHACVRCRDVAQRCNPEHFQSCERRELHALPSPGRMSMTSRNVHRSPRCVSATRCFCEARVGCSTAISPRGPLALRYPPGLSAAASVWLSCVLSLRESQDGRAVPESTPLRGRANSERGMGRVLIKGAQRIRIYVTRRAVCRPADSCMCVPHPLRSTHLVRACPAVS
ncbi:hypothetical protein BC628DRAFT_493580 [Trametes gibbosa]|nr:hypothetical protein BC628DRAFT_493580 [Trametes gibbosa]